MSGPCLCGDPCCGRCFADPEVATCDKCGGGLYRSELPYAERDPDDGVVKEYPGSPNVVRGIRGGYVHVECPPDEQGGDMDERKKKQVLEALRRAAGEISSAKQTLMETGRDLEEEAHRMHLVRMDEQLGTVATGLHAIAVDIEEAK